MQEKYNTKDYIPASFLSDGTINLVALLTILYFEKNNLTIIEEPERNIHPYLISKVINLLLDAAEHKQIIVTTHNPKIIKHVPLENISLISRNEVGHSVISRPAEKEDVKIFLENEIRIEALYIQNLLGVEGGL